MARYHAVTNALPRPSRRAFLATGGAFVAWSHLPRFAYAAGRDPRLIVVILRGALDGLGAVPPVGDPDYATLRGDHALGAADMPGVLPLDGVFGLNDSMPALYARYRAGEALVVHAVATPYRERSHFDGQDVLESGMGGPRYTASGWLNRAVAALPAGDRVGPVSGLAISPTVPLILRGAAPTLTWTPPYFPRAEPDTVERLMHLYAERDAELARAFREGIEIARLTGGPGSAAKAKGGPAAAFREAAVGAARIIAAEDGPRVAALSYDGWDTHAKEGADDGRLAKLLAALDGALEGLAAQLAPVWRDTVVAVITEFGRTARPNGSEGTDHGTATTALLVGGAVKGGRVIADWPGLKPRQLHENRDLAPTTDLRAVLKGVLRDHLGLSDRVLATEVFPGSVGVRPLDDLIA